MISIKYFSFTFLVILVFSVYCVSNLSRQDTSQSVYLNDLSLKNKAITFLNDFNDSKNIDFSIISDLQFIQHDLSLKDGKKEYVKSILSTIQNDFTLEIIRALQDENYVFIQSKQTSSFGSHIVYDVFRFSENLIVEHWINIEDVNPPNPSGRTQIDGAKKIVDKNKTDQNKIFVKDYLTTILIEKRLEDVPAYLNGNEYIQHNSDVADGLHSILDLLNRFEREGIAVGFNKIHKVIGEGNFVLALSEGFYQKDPIAYFDLLRVDNGKIAEHWDVIQAIPPKSEWKNTNGKF